MNFPASNFNGNTLAVNNYPSINYCQIVSKLLILCFIAIESRQQLRFSWKWWKVIWCAEQALFMTDKTITRPRISLTNPMGTLLCQTEWWKSAYWFSLWLHKHEWRRTSGSLNEIATSKTIENIHNMMFVDRRLNVREIETASRHITWSSGFDSEW